MITCAVLIAPRSPIEIRELPDPVLEPGSAMLDTVASEVCGTDVHLFEGHLAGVPYPIIPGHVSVGRLAESRGVTHDALGVPLAQGDLVTFYDVFGTCGSCWYCAVARQPNRCASRRVYGITTSANDGALGGWATRIYLKPGVRILRIPEPLTADEVIGGGCGLFTGYAAVERSDLAMGDTVVVQGVGPVGLGAILFALLRGAGRIIAIGEPDARRALAARFGADTVLAVSGSNAQEREAAVKDATGGRGADVVIEATGNPAAVAEGFGLLRDGGRYVVAGHYTDTGAVEINPHRDINRRHADVRGQWGTDFHHVVRALLMAAKVRDSFPLGDAIAARYALKDAGSALEAVAALTVTKAIIEPNG